MTQEIEVTKLHPAAARWLIQNDYEFAHEYLLKEKRRVDFLARHKSSNEMLIIDCKLKTLLLPRDIKQINMYHEMFNDPSARKVLVFPSGVTKPHHVEKLASHNITVIQVDLFDLRDFWDQFGYSRWFEKHLPS